MGRLKCSRIGSSFPPRLAVFSLPFVYLGLVKDFWERLDRYIEIEKEAASTFFVIPRKSDPGHALNGSPDPRRATHYDVADLGAQVAQLLAARFSAAVRVREVMAGCLRGGNRTLWRAGGVSPRREASCTSHRGLTPPARLS